VNSAGRDGTFRPGRHLRPDCGAPTGPSAGNPGCPSAHGRPEHAAGFVESPRFYPYLSARRNLEFLAAYDDQRDRQAVDDALAEAGLAGRAGDRVGGFSLGMRQRLGVAAALLRRPRLLLLDEPANGLDPAGARDMRALVRDLAADGRTVLLSSHDMGEVEQLCQDVTILRSGRAVFAGTLDVLRARAPDPAHRMRTSDDESALTLAERAPGVLAHRPRPAAATSPPDRPPWSGRRGSGTTPARRSTTRSPHSTAASTPPDQRTRAGNRQWAPAGTRDRRVPAGPCRGG
jgi:ABC-type nitrate/sulfonate/bicarbonate transport system ATPase subunit